MSGRRLPAGLAALLAAVAACAVEPLVVGDAATVDLETARRIVAEIDAGRPAVVVGGPLLSDRRVDWNGEMLALSAARARMDALPAGHVLLGGDRGFDLKGFEHHLGWLTEKGGTLAVDPDGRSVAIRTGGPLKQWDLHYRSGRPYADGDDLLVLEARSETDGAQLQLELNDGKGGRWFATVPLDRAWRHVVLASGDFVGRSELKPREIVRYSFGVSEQYTPRMSGRAGAFHVRLFGSARNPVPGLATGALAFDALPAVEGVWPEYKTYVKDGRVCYLDRPTGEGYGRNNVWRMKRLANASEAILLERRPGRPERAVALFGYRRAEDLADPGVKARMDAARTRLASGALLFEAGAREFAYLPGEAATLGASWRGAPKSLEIAVTDRAGAVRVRRAFGPDELRAGRVDFTWTPPAQPAVYRVEAVLDGDDAIAHDFAVVKAEPDPAEDFITVRDGDFRLHGKPWYPVCINFWPNYSAGTEKADYWDRWMADGWYSPNLVRKDVANFVACGGNALSIQASRAANPRNLRDVLRICREAGVKVNLFLHCANPLAFDAAMARELGTFLRETGVAGDSTVFAFDTVWEPGNYVFGANQRGALDAPWQRWTEEQFGSVARAVRAWGADPGRDAKGCLKAPPDGAFTGAEDARWRKAMASYRRFMDNYTARKWNVLKRALRGLAPRQLQSFRQGNTLPHDFALNGPVRHLDFVMPEGYQFGNTDDGEASIGWVTRYIDAYSRGKPVIWSEFGKNAWDGPSRTTDPARLEECAAYSERFYRAGLIGGANGFSPWWFPGGYRFDERSDFGIMGPDDVPRPPLRVLARHAPEILKPRAKPVPSVWMDFDRDACGGGYYAAALRAGRDAFAAARAEGKVLGVRLAGTSFTSVDCPAVALGDVPLEGRMPAKYLDADFDVFETRQGDDGSLRVRAQLGNPGPAAWKGGDGTGAVRLVVREDGTDRVVAERALARDVPRFGETDTMELALPPTTRRLRFRLEAKDRFAFGEERTWSESAAFLATFPAGRQDAQAQAVRAAVRGEPDELRRVRAARDVEKPLVPGVTRRMVRDDLCLYLPESGRAERTLVYFHGGCWVFGSINSCSLYCMEVAKRGVAVLAYNYPLAPENRPEAVVAGCRGAVAWAMDHAAEWGGSAGRVSVGGDSAGGHLSLAVALTSPADRMPHALLLYYPVTRAWADGGDAWKRFGRGFGLDADLMEAGNAAFAGSDRRNPLVSPACAADDALKRLPPCHVLAAGRDILLDQGRAFHERLRSLGVTTTHETVEGAVHLFVTVPGQPAAFRRAVDFAWERL